MILSGHKSSTSQPLLWHTPLGNHGHARTVVGALAERLTARLVGGVRHKTDCRADYCPDVSVGHVAENRARQLVQDRLSCGDRGPYDGHRSMTWDDAKIPTGSATYFESKAVRGQAFVYAGRLLKDREFTRSHRLVYVIWYHGAATKEASTVEQLEALVLANMRAVYVVPFCAIAAVCGTLREEKLNSKYGRSNGCKNYGSGFRFSVSRLERWCHRKYDDGYQDEPPSACEEATGEVAL